MRRCSNLSLRDWRLIQAPLYGFAGAMLFAALTLLVSQVSRQHILRQLQPLQIQLRDTHAAADHAKADYLAAEQSREHYLWLQASGIIGQEHRLAWVARLNTSATSNLMTKLRYRIDAQKPLELSQPNGNSVLYASKMHLQYVASHEEAFSKAHHLFATDPGRAMPLRCEISRRKANDNPTDNAGLTVDCDYLWLSIAPAVAQSGKVSPP